MAMAGAKNIQTVLHWFDRVLCFPRIRGSAEQLVRPKPDQHGVRQQILDQVQRAAAMFSGYLQTGLYSGLNGSGGLAGWRWLFIFDGIISIPIALCGYYGIPDSPVTTRELWFTKEERVYAVEKMEKLGRVPAKPLTLQIIKKVYSSKYVWAFLLSYVLASYSGYGFNYFYLWLSAAGYSVQQTNFLALALGLFRDYTGRRGYGQEIFQFDGNIHQLLVATGNVGAYTWSAWVGTVLFPTNEAPHYKYSYHILIMFNGIGVIGMLYPKFIDPQIKSGEDKAKEYLAEGEQKTEGGVVESPEARV